MEESTWLDGIKRTSQYHTFGTDASSSAVSRFVMDTDAINANRSFGMVTAISADHIFGMDISANPIWLSFVSIILLLLSIPNFRLVYQVRF